MLSFACSVLGQVINTVLSNFRVDTAFCSLSSGTRIPRKAFSSPSQRVLLTVSRFIRELDLAMEGKRPYPDPVATGSRSLSMNENVISFLMWPVSTVFHQASSFRVSLIPVNFASVRTPLICQKAVNGCNPCTGYVHDARC